MFLYNSKRLKMQTSIRSIATGIAQDYEIKGKIFISAYKKNIFLTSCEVGKLGLENDFQVDARFHGGIDKAIHIGSSKHFEVFKNLHSTKLDVLAIGCNIFIDRYDENDICIGDIYTIGKVTIEVTQPRQPCWKIGALFGKDVNQYIVKQNATGWYVRVLKVGTINATDTMKLEKRVSDITIKELSNYLKNPPKENQKLINKILNMSYLAQAYKDDFNNSLTSC